MKLCGKVQFFVMVGKNPNGHVYDTFCAEKPYCTVGYNKPKIEKIVNKRPRSASSPASLLLYF